MQTKKNPSILLAEDDIELRESIKTALEERDFNVVCANDGYEAGMKIKNQPFDLLISDLKMPKKDGVKLANELISSGLPILLITGELENFEVRLKALEGVMLLPKPFKVEIIPALVAKILSQKKSVA